MIFTCEAFYTHKACEVYEEFEACEVYEARLTCEACERFMKSADDGLNTDSRFKAASQLARPTYYLNLPT